MESVETEDDFGSSCLSSSSEEGGKGSRANDLMIQTPERKEIMETIKGIKGSSPGQDGVRIKK